MSDHSTPDSDLDTGHDYDGIREHDNRLPNWWLATLIVTVVFGYGYWMYFHVMKQGKLSGAEYQAEMDEAAAAARARAKDKGAVTDDALLLLAQSKATVDSGAATFKQSCSPCHGMQAQGLIGPNLTDGFWLHGAKPTDILKTVSTGVAAKGMPAWEPVLGEERIEAVVAFVLTVKNTNVPGKEPQGEPASAAAPSSP